jgi:hypothetical protein
MASHSCAFWTSLVVAGEERGGVVVIIETSAG